MNAFMVFSHYERRKVLAEQPDIQNNTLLSKELGRSVLRHVGSKEY
jgi:hypothetical protein